MSPSFTPPVSQNAEASIVDHTIDPLQILKRDSTWVIATGKLDFGFQSQTFELVVVPGDGDAHPITVHATLKPHDASVPHQPTFVPSAYKPTRRASDAELERDLVPRKRRKLEENHDGEQTRIKEDGDLTSPITRADLNRLLAKLRDDIQEDTSECVNHVQRQVRRSRQECREKNEWEYEQTQRQSRGPLSDAVIANDAIPGASFPSPNLNRDESDASIRDTIQREFKLLSNQIRWLEECRKVGADLHDKREESWQTLAVGFHDRQRQDREAFHNRMLHESGAQSQTLSQQTQAMNQHPQMLNQVLHEVATTRQNIQGETPDVFPHPPGLGPAPLSPASQPNTSAPERERGR